MHIRTKEILDDLLKQAMETEPVRPEEIPGIDLYMDQVTTFMNEHLADTRRHPEDKILTKTMINNYAKDRLLPPPQKKKYSREHLLLLIFIYSFKGFLSIADIRTLLDPLTDRFFRGGKGDGDSDSTITLTDIYREVLSLEKQQTEQFAEDVRKKYRQSLSAFSDAPNPDREILQLFALICMLSFDVSMKKQLIERLLDRMTENGREK
jgi:hypothetical protein